MTNTTGFYFLQVEKKQRQNIEWYQGLEQGGL
jgi:hypothetical protein